MKFLQFIDDLDDSATYPTERLISMTCASHSTLLLNFESSGSGSTAAWAHGHDIVTLTLSEGGAIATITITDYTELNAGDKVNLVATDGNNYDFVQGDQSSVNGTFEATTSNNVTATNLMNVINTSSGPSGTRFTATASGAVVTATQATGGVAGNTTVTLTDSGTAGMSSTNFIDGIAVDKKVMMSIANAINNKDLLVTIADDVKTAAVANIGIKDISSDGTDVTAASGLQGEYFNMVSTDGTTIRYIFDHGGSYGSTGDVYTGTAAALSGEYITNTQDRDISSGTINWIEYSPSTTLATYTEDTTTDDRIEIVGTSGTTKEGAELGTAFLGTLTAGTYKISAKIYSASGSISGFKVELAGVASSAFAISTSTTAIETNITISGDGVLRIYYENSSTTGWFIDDISVKEVFKTVLVDVSGSPLVASVVANELETAIEHSNGHNGKILVNRLSNVLYLTQLVAGTAGNTVIELGFTTPAQALTYTGFSGRDKSPGNTEDGPAGGHGFFSGGKDGTYIDSDITACSIALDT